MLQANERIIKEEQKEAIKQNLSRRFQEKLNIVNELLNQYRIQDVI